MPIDQKKIEEWEALTNAIEGRDRLRLRRIVSPDGAGWIPETLMLTDTEAAAYEVLPEAALVLLSERKEMLDLLREIEWEGGFDTSNGHACCPDCGAWEQHREGCRLAAFLKG